MIKELLIGVAGFCFAISAPVYASAQSPEGFQERVVVTGVRVDPDDFGYSGRRPHVTKRVRAEVILMPFEVVSGTVDSTERRQELRAMFDRTVQAVNATEGFQLEAGSMEERFAIETTKVEDIWSLYGNFGRFSMVLTVDAPEGEVFETVRDRGEDFLDEIEVVGRAQYDFSDEQYIGIKDVKGHRLDLLKSINEDLATLKSIFSSSQIEITGLESAVITQPVEAMTLELHIPYTVTLTKK